MFICLRTWGLQYCFLFLSGLLHRICTWKNKCKFWHYSIHYLILGTKFFMYVQFQDSSDKNSDPCKFLSAQQYTYHESLSELKCLATVQNVARGIQVVYHNSAQCTFVLNIWLVCPLRRSKSSTLMEFGLRLVSKRQLSKIVDLVVDIWRRFLSYNILLCKSLFIFHKVMDHRSWPEHLSLQI